ncbi:hypothetical protein [Entomobacter blattae]|uniref:Uncharacterized protein n=1 Tax=Entomobacter blattae TaxID=2762277 RepID=A0A7H1NTU3_9PROT|nr:hypothetical protein [Entomobacter blattae]QNT79203.1 hypothetical protein JGUZn3_19980 [Entomobacter blattae]
MGSEVRGYDDTISNLIKRFGEYNGSLLENYGDRSQFTLSTLSLFVFMSDFIKTNGLQDNFLNFVDEFFSNHNNGERIEKMQRIIRSTAAGMAKNEKEILSRMKEGRDGD